MDDVDAALIGLDGDRCGLLASYSQPLGDELGDELRSFVSQPYEAPLSRYGALDTRIGEVFAEAARSLLAGCDVPAASVTAIGSHGQTVLHHPHGDHPYTLQIGDPNIIAARTGIMTVADFRRRDIALGGQGAPLVPAFHEAVFSAEEEPRIVLNLGGIANITVMQPGLPTRGFDTGPANTLMDAWCRRHRDTAFDRDGEWAATAETDSALLDALMAHPYFSRKSPKSTGVEEFNLAWVDGVLAEVAPSMAPDVVQSTLCELTARSVAEAVNSETAAPGSIYACGGGAHNRELLKRIDTHLADWSVATTDVLGIGADWVEAAAFGWLAHRRLQNLPGNLPAVTGARSSAILGSVYPGEGNS